MPPDPPLDNQQPNVSSAVPEHLTSVSVAHEIVANTHQTVESNPIMPLTSVIQPDLEFPDFDVPMQIPVNASEIQNGHTPPPNIEESTRSVFALL